MKSILSLGLATLCLTGCSLFYDVPRTDCDFSKAQGESWSRQVAFQNPPQQAAVPTGLGGLPAEEVMKVYHQSFGAKPTKGDVFNMDLTGGNGVGK